MIVTSFLGAVYVLPDSRGMGPAHIGVFALQARTSLVSGTLSRLVLSFYVVVQSEAS